MTFTRLPDGTLLQHCEDGSFRPIASQTDWSRVDAWTDDEIEAMASSDPDHPGTDDAFWADVDARPASSVELDAEIIDFFSRRGGDHRERINAVLRDYVAAHRKEAS